MSTGLTGHGTIFKSLAQIRKEVCGNDVDILSLACTLNCCDSALKRVTAAACRTQKKYLRTAAQTVLPDHPDALRSISQRQLCSLPICQAR